MFDQRLHVKERLDAEVTKRNDPLELTSFASPDPLHVATLYQDEYSALICALYAYGNATAIVKFLSSLDFSLLDASEACIKKSLRDPLYRFQTNEDVIESFITLRRMKHEMSLNELFLKGYERSHQVMDGVQYIIKRFYAINPYRSYGYNFWLGKTFDTTPVAPYKRWNMYLRWMVRNDHIDMGLWQGVATKNLLMPLDTHTHKVALKLGLMKRKSYDFKAVMELTETLRTFDANDPVKYDFALYRLGQEKSL